MKITHKKALVILGILDLLLFLTVLGVKTYAESINLPEVEEKSEEKGSFIAEKAVICFVASLSIIGSSFAAGLALRTVASAGFAASAERPELRTYILILGGLAEGIAIYGLLVAIMILGKI